MSAKEMIVVQDILDCAFFQIDDFSFFAGDAQITARLDSSKLGTSRLRDFPMDKEILAVS